MTRNWTMDQGHRDRGFDALRDALRRHAEDPDAASGDAAEGQAHTPQDAAGAGSGVPPSRESAQDDRANADEADPGLGAGGISEPAPDQILNGEFRLIRVIGRGGMGVVYEAEQLSLHRRVALKMLHPGLAHSKRAQLRFRAEAEAVASLSHSNIIPIFAVDDHRTVPYFAMRFLSGPTLAEVIDKLRTARRSGRREIQVDLDERAGRSTGGDLLGAGSGQVVTQEPLRLSVDNYWQQALALVAEVAEALEVAHAAGIVHRDIKPGNLILDRGGRLVVTDFGIAKTEIGPQLTRTGDFLGSAGYHSPEQAGEDGTGGTDEVGPASDVYSLAVTLLEWLTLEPPRLLPPGAPPSEAPRPRQLEPRLPRDVETVLLRALERDPRKRMASAAVFARELRHILNFEAIESAPASAFTQVGKVLRKRRRPLLLAGVLAAFAGTVAWGIEARQGAGQEYEDRLDLLRRNRRASVRVIANYVSGTSGLDAVSLLHWADDARQRLEEQDVRRAFDSIRGVDTQLELMRTAGVDVETLLPLLRPLKLDFVLEREDRLRTSGGARETMADERRTGEPRPAAREGRSGAAPRRARDGGGGRINTPAQMRLQIGYFLKDPDPIVARHAALALSGLDEVLVLASLIDAYWVWTVERASTHGMLPMRLALIDAMSRIHDERTLEEFERILTLDHSVACRLEVVRGLRRMNRAWSHRGVTTLLTALAEEPGPLGELAKSTLEEGT